MPGPFPGMDPYLEDPDLWPGVHQGLITYMAEVLNSRLPRGYVARMGERVYVLPPERSIYPDVAIVRRSREAEPAGGAGVAVAEAADPSQVVAVFPDEVREPYIEIRAVKGGRQIATVVEVLSYTNKTPGSEGRRLYKTKQREILNSPTHLLEIDLLRQGEHTVAAPLESLLGRSEWDYLVCLHRSTEPYHYEYWPIQLQDRLPRVKVPLLSGDPDVVLDLQEVFNRTYDAGAYNNELDYNSSPPIALRGGDASWADELLKQQGYRS